MKNLALITGASSGIGLEFAFLIAESFEEDIILVARREDRLVQLKKEIEKKHPNKKVYTIPTDISNKNNRSNLWDEIQKIDGHITLLVNNAGFGSFGNFTNSNIDNEINMINLNCEAIVDLCHKVLPNMISNNYGKIINVSSMASFQGIPFLATYAATKAFVTSFSLALAQEVSQYNIHIQALCPGPVPTEFGQVAGFPDKISLTTSIAPKTVVQMALDGLKYNKMIVIPGFSNFILAQLNRLIPRALASKITYYILDKKFK